MQSEIDRRLNEAVDSYRRYEHMTVQELADCLGMNRSSFNDRMRGTTPWRLHEANYLACIGVMTPILGVWH